MKIKASFALPFAIDQREAEAAFGFYFRVASRLSRGHVESAMQHYAIVAAYYVDAGGGGFGLGWENGKR